METNSINILLGVSNFINKQIILMELNIYLHSINKTKLIGTDRNSITNPELDDKQMRIHIQDTLVFVIL